MMKIFYTILFLCLCFPMLALENPVSKDPRKVVVQELEHLESLIESTQASLNLQMKLKAKILDYQIIQKKYLETKDKDLRYKMVQSAYEIITMIEEAHLKNLFNSEFISELSLLANYANKVGVNGKD